MLSFVRTFVSRPVFTWVVSFALLVFGAFSFTSLSVDRFPNIDIPIVTVVTVYPGASPEQVETEISDPVEEALSSISGVNELSSTSFESLSVVRVMFELEKDGDVGAQEVRDRVNRILSQLPASAETPRVEKIDPDATPLIYVAVSGPGTPQELTEFAKENVKERLQGGTGIGDIRLYGGREREIRIEVEPSRLDANQLTVIDVQRALVRENLELPGGTMTQGDKSLQVRVPGRVESAAQFAELPVAKRDGHIVTIGHVADVVDSAIEPASYAVFNGEPVVLLAIVRQSGTNAIEVADGIMAKLDEIRGELPPGYALDVVRDESAFVRTAVHAVQEHLILGALCAVVVVLLFLRSGRSTVIASLSIPFSIVATFAVLAALDLTLNLLTLLALTLAVGIVIDDAIVVLENVVRFLEERTEDPEKATLDATKDIALAVLATTLSLVAVFLPLAFIGGIMGRFLSSFGLAMTAAVLVSLLIAFTLTPMLCARWLKRTGEHGGHRPHPPEGADAPMTASEEKNRFRQWRRGETEIELNDGWLERGYVKLLAFCMERRWIVGAAIAVSLSSIFVVGPMIPASFLPEDDESRFEITVDAPEGTSLGQTELISDRISAQIRALPEVAATVVTVGSDEGDISGRGSHQASIYVSLVPDSERERSQFEVQDVVRDKILPAFVTSNAIEYTLAPVSAFGGSGPKSAPVQYVLRGPDLKKLDEYSTKIAEAVRAVPGVAQADTTFREPRPEIHVTIDRARAAELGVTVQDVAMALRVLVGGTDVTTYEQDGDQFDVQLRAREKDRQTSADLDRYRVRNASGELVPLSQVASVTTGEGPAAIERLGRGRSVLIYATVQPGASTNAILQALDDTAASLDMPATYSTTVTGQSREFKKAATSFLIAIILSFIFMYMIIAAQFESWLHPITILSSLPLTVPFALISLLIFRQSLNIFSALGLLVLFGIVKKNSILQVDHMLSLRREGYARVDAVMLANRDRLRPILMTTFAFVAGMTPLMLSGGPGSGTNRATAGIVLGGQTLSLLLTLLATPAIFCWLDDLQRWTRAQRDAIATRLRRLVSKRPSAPATEARA